jgi:N-sulfoglucosamine sulfohydrolase
MNPVKSHFISFLILGFILSACMESHDPGNKNMIKFDPTSQLTFKPNILWIVTEDLSPILPAYGDSTVKTPNIDRLARDGIVYTNVFSPSGVCAPSRCALTTGMYPSSIGGHNMRVQYVKAHMDQLGLVLYEVVPPPEVKMMSQVLRENGYYCSNNDKQDYQFSPPVTAWDETSLKAHWRNRKSGQPFFSIFNIGVTHEGHVTRPYRKVLMRYHDPDFPESIDNPEGFDDLIKDGEWTLNVPENLEVPVPPYLPATEVAKRDVRRVYSNIVELDRQVGIILNQLEQDHLIDSTIVFFYSDHGGPLPRQKRLIYDSGIKLPMIIRYPGKAGAGHFDDQLISFVDFAPTVFSLVGIKIPKYIQGQAFLGAHKSRRPRKYIHAAADRLDAQVDMVRAVRDNRYKYILNFYPDKPYYLPVAYREEMAIMQELLRLNDKDSLDEYQAQWFRKTKDKEELFDTRVDPYELKNLANNPEYKDKLEELRKECTRWMADINDMGKIPEADILETFWPGRQQPVTAPPVYETRDGHLEFHSETEGANIAYRIYQVDESPPDAWRVYTEPIQIDIDMKVEALAHRLGYAPSKTIKIEFR